MSLFGKTFLGTWFKLKIPSRLMALCLSVMYFFTPYTSPAKDTPIASSDSCRMKFIAWADPQISNYILKRDRYFLAACEDVTSSKESFDAMLIAGDIAENGLPVEYAHVTGNLPVQNIRQFVMATGNHDIRLHPYKMTVRRFTEFTNTLNRMVGCDFTIDALHYKTTVKGYTFLVLGSDRTEFEEAYLSDAQLQWLDSELQAACGKGKPVFVTVHQPFKLTHGLPDTWGSPVDAAGSIGPQSDALKAILSKYSKNVILISGHLHTGFGQYTYEKIDGIHSVNLPSLTIDNKDGRVNDNGLGCWVEVFRTKVVFHARNFATGTDIPSENIVIKF